jgi:hypothetical protein
MEQIKRPSSMKTQVRQPKRKALAPIVERALAIIGDPTAKTASLILVSLLSLFE